MRIPLLLSLAIATLAAAAQAAPLSKEDVPTPLKPWVKWVLAGHEEALCPFLQGAADDRACAWPSALTLELREKGGSFSQNWRLYAESWVALPGEARAWPQKVKVDGAPAVVILRGEAPGVKLKSGPHAITGSFEWDAPPEMLSVPVETGLLSLTVLGKEVAFPVRDESGRLWVQKARKEEAQESHLTVAVHRLVIDELPLQLATQIQLKVSGKNREVLLGKALPAGFVAMSLTGPLPARLDPDGRLRVQARAGTWDLSLVARHLGPAKELALAPAGGTWDDEEAWAFAAHNELRLVDVEGAPAIDPQQTEMPEGWRSYPTYLMKPGSALKLTERSRGDADPESDRLGLMRRLWLDFDGRGLSVQDSLSGRLSRSWRLEMGPETQLGRAASDGRDQFLTSLKPGGPAGIEVRQGQVSVQADSRIDRRGWSLPAVGWSHDFERVSAHLQLPPGWRLIYVSGVDAASPTWVGVWTLLDLFLVVILGLSVGRLWGPRWGGSALFCAALAWHEPGAPRWAWLIVLAAEALARVLPEGGFQRAVHIGRKAAWGLLVLIAIPFAVQQLRTALHPQLEQSFGWMKRGSFGRLSGLDKFQSGSLAEPEMSMVSGAASEMGGGGGDLRGAQMEAEELRQNELSARQMARRELRKSKKAGRVMAVRGSAGPMVAPMLAPMAVPAPAPAAPPMAKQSYALDPKTVVNTGPGLPNWSWREVSLTWKGPVAKDQRMRFWLVSPCLEFFLTLTRVALMALLILLFLGLPVGAWLEPLRTRTGWQDAFKRILPVLLLAVSLAPAHAQEADDDATPTPAILQELANRLLEAPDCSPRCAEIPRLRLEVTPSLLRARLEVHAAAATAIPLPGGAKQWSPSRVLLGGVSAPVRRDSGGSLWLALPAGSHEVLLEGALSAADSIQLALPLKPRRVELSAVGWTVDGVHEDGEAEDDLQLSRAQGLKAAGVGASQQGNYPPFLRVERTLKLGLSWTLATRVARLTPAGSPVVVQVPLLPGESVTTPGLRVAKGKAEVHLGPQAEEASWESVLNESPALKLTASEAAGFVELWNLELGPVWHAEVKGLAPVHQDWGEGIRMRQWRPWPGESIELAVTRPQGVAGQTFTIDSSVLALQPGLRASDATLTLSLRSSRGGVHAFTLPEGAELKSVHIDGRLEPVRQEGRKVSLPIQPGSHGAALSWRQTRGLGLFYRTPAVDLGAASVNASVRLSMPVDRWTLFLGGPRLGPAVQFWSLLAVFFLISLGLGRLDWTPLRARQWFLLLVGLTQVPITSAALVAVWLLALGLRKKHTPQGAREFDAAQAFLVFLTLLALSSLFNSIKQGLLGLPDMQISGNGSTSQLLAWYQDRAGLTPPRAWVLSVPLLLYRACMLAWALWLADSLLAWLRWGWECFSSGGLWRPMFGPARKLVKPDSSGGAA
ncbi:MAG: hypothetical protein AAB320_03060 [Elusimicrobiota bacterium]